MGKSKRRIIAKGRFDRLENMSRDEAIEKSVQLLEKGEDIGNLVSLFGLKPEELLEAGADYESVKSYGEFF